MDRRWTFLKREKENETLKKENAILQEIAKAKAKVDALRGELQTLEKENEELVAFEQMNSLIQLYERNAKSNERIAELLNKAKKKLKSLRRFTDQEVRAYEAKRSDLQKRIQEAHEALSSIKR